MLIFRTILLWLSFFLLVAQYFIDFNSSVTIGLVFRLAPSGFLLFWFILSFFFKEKLLIHADKTSRSIVILLNLLRPSASISIVIGAIFKIMHWPFGNLLLLAGIGFMAVYSSLLSKYASVQSKQNPDILDDLNDTSNDS